MHLSSNSPFESDYNGDDSERQSSESASPYTTPPSSAPESRKSSIKSGTTTSTPETKQPSLKSALKSHKSSPSLGVRFFLPERPQNMLSMEFNVPPPPSFNDWPLSSERSARQINVPSNAITEVGFHPKPNAPPSIQMQPTPVKRYSTPPKLSRKETDRPYTASQAYYSSQSRMPTPRVASYQSTASAPAVLYSNPTPLSPSQPPSQYNPLEHYIPCMAPSCDKLYTSSLLGPTFYLPQQPHQLIRMKGLCARCANRDLGLANNMAKQTFESMRQNAGRKTLGQIAIDFEIWKHQYNQDRALESDALASSQRKKVLKVTESENKRKGKVPVPSPNNINGGDSWDWRYTPRPCTRKDCTSQWFSPFDKKLYLLYHTPRSSGLVPLPTLCPRCAKEDVEAAEERMEGRRSEAATGSAVWQKWCEEMRKDRRLEVEFWEATQEKLVREKGVDFASSSGDKEENGKGKKIAKAKKEVKDGEEGKKSKNRKIKDICIVM